MFLTRKKPLCPLWFKKVALVFIVFYPKPRVPLWFKKQSLLPSRSWILDLGFWTRSALFLLLLTVIPQNAHAVIKVVYPVNGTAVKTATITILGVTSTPEKTVIVSLNGTDIVVKVDSDGVFAQSLRLKKWWNVLKVDGEQIKVFFAFGGKALPENAIMAYPHQAAMEGCTDCHEFDSEGGVELAEEGKELCLMCHDDPTLGKDGKSLALVHSPIADDDDCTYCHDPHQGNNRALNLETMPELCYQCHDSVSEKGSGKEFKQIHEPVDGGYCTECHNPHASEFGKLLLLEGSNLCLQCHDNPADGKVVHEAVSDDDCTDCHGPHSSDSDSLLIEDIPGLCLQCHDDPAAGKVVHTAVSDGSCTDCHGPHASKYSKLLLEQTPELCFQCHDNPTFTPDGDTWLSRHPPAEEDCTNCHSPHSSDNEYNLTDEIFELCSGCHDEHPPHSLDASKFIDADSRGIVSLPPDFPTTFEGLMICTGCHLPHGSRNARLLVAPKRELCGICH